MLHAESGGECGDHDDAATYSAEGAKETCCGSYDEGDDDGFHFKEGKRLKEKG
jgi:hypothetical protein